MKLSSISVIIPCFNCQATIAETLASVAAQTLPPKEVILVDDGSSDRTWELLHELRQGHYPHLMLLSHPDHENHGASMARALGVAHASGEYIEDLIDCSAIALAPASQLLAKNAEVIDGLTNRKQASRPLDSAASPLDLNGLMNVA